jgi:RNA polymerase sigma-70 factor, ECF subfamily
VKNEALAPPTATAADRCSSLSDSQLVEQVRAGDRALFEILVRRHNQRMYRTIRAVLHDEHEVEDAMQQAYVNAFVHLHQFQERSQFSTWLTRIALNEAFGRRRKMRAVDALPAAADAELMLGALASPQPDPERQAYVQELRIALEAAIDALPETYRLVLMLRDVEGLSTSETGEALGLGDVVIKTRLHRARAMIRRLVTDRLGESAPVAFPFPALRCDRVVSGVLAAIDGPPFS